MPGERPNFNHHVLNDNKLLKLVQGTQKRQERTTKIEILQHLPKIREKPSKVHADLQGDPFSNIEPEVYEENHSHAKPDVCRKLPKIKRQNIQQKVPPVHSKKPLINQPLSSIEAAEPTKPQSTGIREVSNKHELPKETISVMMPKIPIINKRPVTEYPKGQLKEKTDSPIQESATTANPSSFKAGMQGVCREHSSHSLERPSVYPSKREQSWATPSANNSVSSEKVIINIKYSDLIKLYFR